MNGIIVGIAVNGSSLTITGRFISGELFVSYQGKKMKIEKFVSSYVKDEDHLFFLKSGIPYAEETFQSILNQVPSKLQVNIRFESCIT